MQYIDSGKLEIIATLLIVAFVLFNIYRAKGKKDLFIRRIAGLNAIDDAIGRATEMGRPIIMVPGIGALDAISVQAVNVFAQVAKTAAKFATPIRICCADPAVYTVAQESIRDAYNEVGMPDRYDPDSVQFVSDRQFAFAAGVSGMILREKAAASFLLGAFYAESLIFAESANSVGAIQIAGSTQTTQTPFFIAACDYVLIGDEYYAASAYLTRQPVLVGSLVGQDWAKFMIVAALLIGFVSNSIDRVTPATQHRGEDDDKGTSLWKPVSGLTKSSPDYFMKNEDTRMYQLFHPFVTDKDLDVKREKDPSKPKAAAGAGS